MTDDSFRGAVEAYRDRVYGYAAWMLRDREEAGDVAQEAFVRLWEHRATVDEASARAWLLRTAHNLCIDRTRRRAVRQGPPAEEALPFLEDPGPGPDRLADGALAAHAIARALETLSPRDRSAVLLREVQGLPYETIAGMLDVPLGTLKAVLHRSRERLRRELVAEGVTP